MASRPPNAATSLASLQRAASPCRSPVPRRRRCDVEKNTGSMWSKSFSSLHALHQHRAHHAAPTDNPTRMIVPIEFRCAAFPSRQARPDASPPPVSRFSPGKRRDHRVAHRPRADRPARRAARCRAVRKPCGEHARAPRASMRSATSARAKVWRNIIATDRIVASGFAMSLPAMSGARAVDRLVESLAVRIERRRRQHADRAGRASTPRRTGCRRTCCR